MYILIARITIFESLAAIGTAHASDADFSLGVYSIVLFLTRSGYKPTFKGANERKMMWVFSGQVEWQTSCKDCRLSIKLELLR